MAEIPSELKELVDADRRSNKTVVIAALWREFGGERKGHMERRIEEKQQRITMLERERNERNREIAEEQEELEQLKTMLERMKTQAEREEEQAIEQAVKVIQPNKEVRSVDYREQLAGPEKLVDVADGTGLTPQQLHERAVEEIMAEREGGD